MGRWPPHLGHRLLIGDTTMTRMVYTDDAARRQVFVYKELGFDVRIPVLLVGFPIVLTSIVLTFVVTSPIELVPGLSTAGTYLLRVAIALALGGVGSILLIRKVAGSITPETPIRYWIQAFRNDLHSPRPNDTVSEEVIDASTVRFSGRSSKNRTVVAIPLPPFPPSN